MTRAALSASVMSVSALCRENPTTVSMTRYARTSPSVTRGWNAWSMTTPPSAKYGAQISKNAASSISLMSVSRCSAPCTRTDVVASDRSRGVGGDLDLPDSDACVAALSLHHPRSLGEASGQLSLQLGECRVAMRRRFPSRGPGAVEHVFGADEGDGLRVRAHPHARGREVVQDRVEAGAVLAAADRVDPHEDAVDCEQLGAHLVTRSRRGRSLGSRSRPEPPGRRRRAGAVRSTRCPRAEPPRRRATPLPPERRRFGRHAVDGNERRGGPVSGSGDR